MTVALVRQVIHAFLSTPNPQVLCIRGKWGVGKTYIWNEVFKQAKADSAVALPHYCYVSLFGLQSIDEVRQTIFENRVTTKKIEIEPTLSSLRENINHYALEAGKQFSKLSPFAKLPYIDRYIANFSGGFRQVVSLAVRDTIICFDDFERKKLSTKDLLGLVSQFREQRRCKAVIILNEDALSDDEKVEFRRYFEKVVDVPVEFSPTPFECADIAIKGTDFVSQRIRENTIALGISNIRIIERIKSVSEGLLRILESYGDGTRYQAIHTLTLLIWSKYDADAIPLKFIAERGERNLFFLNKDERTEEEKKWGPKLEAYKFNYCDELDRTIMKGVETGLFDHDEIAREAQLQDERQADSASKEALYRAWRVFHDSFENDVPEVVEAIYSTYKQNMKSVSRGNLDEAVSMFRILGYPDKASELIAIYMEYQGEIRTVDEPSNPFHSVIKDEEFRKALVAAVVLPTPKSMKVIFTDIYKGKFHQEDIVVAAAMSVVELYELFKGLKGDELYPVVEGSLFYRRVINATDEQKELTNRAVEALERIGRESQINAIRVRKFSVNVDAEGSEAVGSRP